MSSIGRRRGGLHRLPVPIRDTCLSAAPKASLPSEETGRINVDVAGKRALHFSTWLGVLLDDETPDGKPQSLGSGEGH